MTKQEFLEGLRERLLEEGASVLVPENLNYYDSYKRNRKEERKRTSLRSWAIRR